MSVTDLKSKRFQFCYEKSTIRNGKPYIQANKKAIEWLKKHGLGNMLAFLDSKHDSTDPTYTFIHDDLRDWLTQQS